MDEIKECLKWVGLMVVVTEKISYNACESQEEASFNL